eukprot:8297665-Karenia_brevis.AAC.1
MAMTLLPDSVWWADDKLEYFESIPPHQQEIFGISQQYLEDRQFLSWLEPYRGCIAKSAFRVLNGAEQTIATPGLLPQVQGHPSDAPSCFTNG